MTGAAVQTRALFQLHKRTRELQRKGWDAAMLAAEHEKDARRWRARARTLGLVLSALVAAALAGLVAHGCA